MSTSIGSRPFSAHTCCTAVKSFALVNTRKCCCRYSFTLCSLSLVDADAAAAAIVAHATLSVMWAHEAPPALLAPSPLPQMLADAAPPAVFAGPPLSCMRKNAASAAVRAPRFDTPVLALWHRAPRTSCLDRRHSCMAAAASGRTNCNVRSRSTRGKSCRRQQHSRPKEHPHRLWRRVILWW